MGKMKTRTPLKKVADALNKRFKGRIVLEGPYTGAHEKALFKCLNCGNVRQSTFYEKLKSTYGCKGCSISKNHKYTHEQFMELFATKPGSERIRVTGRYNGSSKTVEVECLECAHVWAPSAGNLLHSNNGCPQCAKYGTARYDFKAVKLGSRAVRVQGYEPQALEWLVKVRDVRPRDIEVFSERKIPEIKYKWKGRNRNYRPDILVGNTLYEVKSIWTLFFAFEMNKAKSKAATAAGYEHRILLCSNTEVCLLPEDWITKKEVFIAKWFRRKTAKPMTILALDPGVQNFGWAVLRTTGAHKFEVVATGMLKNTLRSLNVDLNTQAEIFLGDLDNLLDIYEPTGIAVERFMSRGMKGTTIELVNVMIGMVLSKAAVKSRRKFIMIPASQWKNEINRNSSLDSLYAAAPTCTPHQMDAVGIALYSAYFWYDAKPFEGFSKHLKLVAKQAMETNREEDSKVKPKSSSRGSK